MKIAVIIPTYNEAESIGSLIYSLENELGMIPKHDFQILVVDANSPDGTAKVVEDLKNSYKNIELLAEPRRGLGIAYISGMNHAIFKLNADAILEFDGDFQHDPQDIKHLVAELDNGYDYIIGSRYVPGGEIPQECSWHKKFLSKYGSLFIRKVLNLPTRDNTSGFKLSRVKFAQNLPLHEDKILSRLHAYKIHLLYEMIKMGAKTKEVPIKFLERSGGNSKSTVLDIFESLKVVSVLKFRSLFKS